MKNVFQSNVGLFAVLVVSAAAVVGCGKPELPVESGLSPLPEGRAVPSALWIAPEASDGLERPDASARRTYRAVQKDDLILFQDVIQLEWARTPRELREPGDLRLFQQIKPLYLVIGDRDVKDAYFIHRVQDSGNRIRGTEVRHAARRDPEQGYFYLPLTGLLDDPSEARPELQHELVIELHGSAMRVLRIQFRVRKPGLQVIRKEEFKRAGVRQEANRGHPGIGNEAEGLGATRFHLRTETFQNLRNVRMTLNLEGESRLRLTQVVELLRHTVRTYDFAKGNPIFDLHRERGEAVSELSELEAEIDLGDGNPIVAAVDSPVSFDLEPGQMATVRWFASVANQTAQASCAPAGRSETLYWKPCKVGLNGQVEWLPKKLGKECVRWPTRKRKTEITETAIPVAQHQTGFWAYRVWEGNAEELSQAEERVESVDSGLRLQTQFAGLPLRESRSCEGLF